MKENSGSRKAGDRHSGKKERAEEKMVGTLKKLHRVSGRVERYYSSKERGGREVEMGLKSWLSFQGEVGERQTHEERSEGNIKQSQNLNTVEGNKQASK